MGNKKAIASVVFTVAFLAIALWGIDFHEVGKALSQTSVVALVPSALALLLVQVFRVVRWWVLVDAARPTPLRKVVPHALIGYFMIVTLPFRAGEFVRPALLLAKEGIPFTLGLATCVVERVADLVALVVLLIIVLGVGVPAQSLHFGSTEITIGFLSKIALIAAAGALGVLIALLLFRAAMVRVCERIVGLVSPALAAKVGGMLNAFADGLSILPDLRRVLAVIVLTAGVWGGSAAALYLCFAATGLGSLPFIASGTTLAVVMVAVSIPLTPGFVGNFQLAFRAALALYAVNDADAIAVSVVYHIMAIGVAILMGLPVLGGLGEAFRLFEERRGDAEARNAAAKR